MIKLLPIAALLAASPALAEPQMAGEHRLSPAEVEQVLGIAADKRIAEERVTGIAPFDVLDPLRGPLRGLRPSAPFALNGSASFSIGSRGYRAAEGRAVLGLGGSSSVAISVQRSEGERNIWIAP